MHVKTIDTVIVGGGQAGIAMSEHLSNHGIDHIVFEKHRIAEAWRSGRWDSLVMNGPAWHDRFPNMEFATHAPDEFPDKDAVADYMEAYAKHFNAPIHTGVEVTKATKKQGGSGFVIDTTQGVYYANHIVAATGPFQIPVIPPVIPESAPVHQLHSAQYDNPEQLPAGAVMVVGAGSSGAQIAEELMLGGRQTYLSVGPHDRPPRAYRGRDFCWWLGVLGLWDMVTPSPGTEHVTIAVSGANGGRTVDFRRFAGAGMQLVGVTTAYDNGILHFADDVRRNIDQGDASYRALLDQADAYIERNGLDLPQEPDARKSWAEPECLKQPIRSLDLAEANVQSVIWATGYRTDYAWLDVNALNALDAEGRPEHRRGISSEPGVYFLGLPWQSRRGSSFIWGVWHDAKFIADQIAIRHAYMRYRPAPYS